MIEFEYEELGRTSILGTRSFALKAKSLDQTFQIDVAQPSATLDEGQRLPVVYVLDGNATFAGAVSMARLLRDDGLPPLLIVGIGYRFDEARPLEAQFFETRTRDYTPTRDDPWLETTRDQLARRGTVVDRATTGGAAAFLAFLENEVKPFIASRYAVDPDDQTLTGMSLGGLFTLYALFQRPGSFARYGAFSPSLWWHDRILLQDEAALAARSSDLPTRLFVSVGENENGAPYDMVSNLQTLVDRLRGRAYATLQLKHHVFGDETHASVYPASLSRGLRELFLRM